MARLEWRGALGNGGSGRRGVARARNGRAGRGLLRTVRSGKAWNGRSGVGWLGLGLWRGEARLGLVRQVWNGFVGSGGECSGSGLQWQARTGELRTG